MTTDASDTDLADHPEVPCGIGDWDSDAYGHHRFVIDVVDHGHAVRVVVPWRRHDLDPTKVASWLISPTGRRIRNVVRRRIDSESGEFVFQPIDGPGRYALYYLPFAHTGSPYYPQAVYRTAASTADPDWSYRLDDDDRLPRARVVGYEASSVMDSLAGLGFAATAAERSALIDHDPDALFWIFGEDRDHAFGRADYLPARWARSQPAAPINVAADRGEFRALQVGLFAVVDLDDVTLNAERFPFAVRHLTGGGVGEDGVPVTRRISVPAGWTQSLWVGIDIPADCSPGEVRGELLVEAGGQRRTIEVTLRIGDRVLDDQGVSDPGRLARLAWLDDTTGHGHDVVTPYEPIKINNRRLEILGRQVDLDQFGLPRQLSSTFTPAVTAVDGPRIDLLSGPVSLHLGRQLRPEAYVIEQAGDGLVRWQVEAADNGMIMTVDGSLEADGCLSYRFGLTAREPIALPDVRFALPLRREIARYWMGLGQQGRLCPDTVDWTWDVAAANQDGAWIGSAQAGLQTSFRDQNYRRPLNTNYYTEQPLREPSWAGGGTGGLRLRSDEDTRTFEAYTGGWDLAAGESLTFDVRILLTPFKPIEPQRQLADRYLHAYADPAAIAAQGGTVVNLHHASPPNPYINDPMRGQDQLAAFVADAHSHRLRVKIYDTVRELTRAVPELPALVALGHEVFAAGPGGGHAWLQEHLPPDYVPGWAATTVDDVAIVTAGESRWHNIYVRTVEYLAEQVGIDGLYLDDVSYDRTTMKRIRKVLAKHRPDPLIDLHSANQYNPRDGYASSANLYLDLMPYLDRLWFGEYVDYEHTDPAYWLVEVSGIAFGLMGEMLQDGGNPWRGMVFGMTGRAPSVDNGPIWAAWDELGLTNRSMIGWWAGADALTTDDPQVLATVFVGPDDAVIALASWNDRPAQVRLDQARLADFGPAEDLGRLVLTADKIDNFQDAATFAIDQPIEIEPGRGWLLHLHRRY